MVDCLARLPEAFAPAPPTTAQAGVQFAFSMSTSFAAGVRRGFPSVAGDAITGVCNRSMAGCAVPMRARVTTRFPAAQTCLDDVIVAVGRAARAHDVHVTGFDHDAADDWEIRVELNARQVRKRESPTVGDSIVALAASGLHGHEHEAALHALDEPALAAADLATIFAPVRAYRSVLFEPNNRGWFRSGVAIGEAGLVGDLRQLVPEGMAAELRGAPWPETSALAWMLGPEPIANNAGVGIALIVPRESKRELIDHVALWGEHAWEIGSVVATS